MVVQNYAHICRRRTDLEMWATLCVAWQPSCFLLVSPTSNCPTGELTGTRLKLTVSRLLSLSSFGDRSSTPSALRTPSWPLGILTFRLSTILHLRDLRRYHSMPANRSAAQRSRRAVCAVGMDTFPGTLPLYHFYERVLLFFLSVVLVVLLDNSILIPRALCVVPHSHTVLLSIFSLPSRIVSKSTLCWCRLKREASSGRRESGRDGRTCGLSLFGRERHARHLIFLRTALRPFFLLTTTISIQGGLDCEQASKAYTIDMPFDYLPASRRHNLQLYKYSGADHSFISRHVLTPYWNWLVSLFPLWVAPNTITLSGLALVGLNFATLLIVDPALQCGTDAKLDSAIYAAHNQGAVLAPRPIFGRFGFPSSVHPSEESRSLFGYLFGNASDPAQGAPSCLPNWVYYT